MDDSVCVLRRRAQYLSDVILSAHLPSGGEMFHFLWHRTSVILSQRRKGRQVYQVGGGCQDCRSASHCTAGHGDDWWTAVSHSRSPGCSLLYMFYKDRQEGMIRKTGRVVSNLSCGEMKDVCVWGGGRGYKHQPYQSQLSSWHQDWCSEMSFPTLWSHKVVVFQGCGGHITVTGGDFFRLHPCKYRFHAFRPNLDWRLIIFIS